MARIVEEMEISLEEVLLLPPETLESVLAAMEANNSAWDRESVTEERDTDRWEQRLRDAIGHRVGRGPHGPKCGVASRSSTST